jgi:predicted FMN-binding regulatory protein PaiB
MYIPSHYRNTDTVELISFIRANAFGLLVSNGDQIPNITHLPFAVESESPLTLSSHLAMANPHGKALLNDARVTVYLTARMDMYHQRSTIRNKMFLPGITLPFMRKAEFNCAVKRKKK